MSKHDFRRDAREAIGRAERQLADANADESRLRYAALDARLALEAMTYDRAQAYGDDLPESSYNTWRPQKVMQTLLDIDPRADSNSFIRIGREDTHGGNVPFMQDLGECRVIDMKAIKRHYDALGNYLHVPTLKQVQKDSGQDFARLKSRLEEITGYISHILSSPISNFIAARHATQRCPRCDAVMRWRVPSQPGITEAFCRECSAPFDIELLANGTLRWAAQEIKARCANEECREEAYIWRDKVTPGNAFTCDHCGRQSVIALGVQLLDAKNNPQT